MFNTVYIFKGVTTLIIQHNDTQHKGLICDNKALGITMLCLYTQCDYILCHVLYIVMLNVVMLSVIILNVAMLSVIMLSVVAPF